MAMRKASFALAVSLSLTLPVFAHAATLIALDLAALIKQSDHVVVAHAESETSRYVDGLIVSDVTLRVITSLKGSSQPGAALVATHIGGSVGQVELSVPGAAHFVIGQSAIVFLRRVPNSHDLNITGMSQGVMSIVGAGSSAQVSAGGSGATLMQRDANGAFVPMPDTAPQPQSLATVLADIQRLVATSN
jgi:hypothetical protein